MQWHMDLLGDEEMISCQVVFSPSESYKKLYIKKGKVWSQLYFERKKQREEANNKSYKREAQSQMRKGYKLRKLC